MKKLAKKLDKFVDWSMIELSDWTRDLFYEFLIEIIGEILQNEDRRICKRSGR